MDAEPGAVVLQGGGPQLQPQHEQEERRGDRQRDRAQPPRRGVDHHGRADHRAEREREAEDVREEQGEERGGERCLAAGRGALHEPQGEADAHREQADRADEIQEAPVREVGPDHAEAEHAEQGAPLHPVEHHGEARRQEREHHRGGGLRRGHRGEERHQRRADHVHRQVGHRERLELELLAEVPLGVQVLRQVRGLRGVEWQVGHRRVADDREGVGDDVEGGADHGEGERRVERGAADPAGEADVQARGHARAALPAGRDRRGGRQGGGTLPSFSRGRRHRV